MKDRGSKIRCYDYVNHPYERVCDVLKQNALMVFQSATKTAAARAQTVAAELRVDFAGIGVKTDIKIDVKRIDEKVADSSSMLMKGELLVYPLTTTETQLDFSGVYRPPLGTVGKTMNAIVGHRIAEVSVHRFVSDVAGYLRQTLS